MSVSTSIPQTGSAVVYLDGPDCPDCTDQERQCPAHAKDTADLLSALYVAPVVTVDYRATDHTWGAVA